MNWKLRGWMTGLVGAGVAALVVGSGLAWAADHGDGPRAVEDPSADIDDIFAWMTPDASRLNLVMTVFRDAPDGALFSDAVSYQFRATSQGAFGDAPSPEVVLECTFDPTQLVTCAIGDTQVSGDARRTDGIVSPDGRLRVFTGLRNDPFFFNGGGFRATARAVTEAAPSLTFDEAGCPLLDAATSSALVTQLRSAPGGGPPRDAFVGFNALAIVAQVDKSLVTSSGPVVAVWGTTSRRRGS